MGDKRSYPFLKKENKCQPLRSHLTITIYLSFLVELEENIVSIFNEVKNNKNLIYYSSGLGLLIVLIFAIYFYRSISKPLSKLREGALQVGEGDLNYRLNIESQDEIGDLAICFQQMTTNLKVTTVSKFYLDKILNSMSDSLIVLDRTGIIQEVNSATCQLLGYSQKEIIGLNLNNILAQKDLYSHQNFNNKKLTYLSKSGVEIQVILSSSLLLNKSNEPCGSVCVAKDITELHQAQKELEISQERYALAANATNDGLWDWNLLTNEIYYSPRWKKLLGYEETGIQSDPNEWFERVPPQYRFALKKVLENNQNRFQIIYPIEFKAGGMRWMSCQGFKVKDKSEQIIRIVGSQTDITDQRLAEEKLTHAVNYDRLTGLANRYYFESKLTKLLEINSQTNNLFCVIFIDLDGFKLINDSLGHYAGDELLKLSAQRMLSCLRSQDLIARFGGDEFAILLTQIGDLQEAKIIAERLQKQLKLPAIISQREVRVSASMGLTLCRRNYTNINDILRDADIAMYRAKASGKDNLIVFKPSMYSQNLQRLDLEQNLRKAIELDQLEIVYQPIVKLNNQEIIGFEALIRWNHPEKGEILPAEFIPIAEETGLIVEIGNWLLEKLVAQMALWMDKYFTVRDFYVSLNISTVQLKQSDGINFIELLQKILSKYPLKPEVLHLEIEESSLMENINSTVNILTKIRDLGVKIAMDDFGTGYSSLNNLRTLPIDTLKIDKTFLSQLEKQSYKIGLIKTILKIADNLNLQVVVEGIETKEQLAILQEFNCKYGQGYLFSQPVNAKLAENLIFNLEDQYINGKTNLLSE